LGILIPQERLLLFKPPFFGIALLKMAERVNLKEYLFKVLKAAYGFIPKQIKKRYSPR
jgi:hypothetical protein